MPAEPSAASVGSQRELTIRQAAAMLNVSCPFVLRLISNCDVKGVRTMPSGLQRIPLAEIERLKAGRMVGIRAGSSRRPPRRSA